MTGLHAVAICITGQLRSLHIVYANWISGPLGKILIQGNKVHWYVVSSDSNSYFAHATWISKVLKPTASLIVHDYIPLHVSGQAWEWRLVESNDSKAKNVEINTAELLIPFDKWESSLIQGWQCLQCSRLIKQTEAASSIQYLHVVRLRTDVVFTPYLWPTAFNKDPDNPSGCNCRLQNTSHMREGCCAYGICAADVCNQLGRYVINGEGVANMANHFTTHCENFVRQNYWLVHGESYSMGSREVMLDFVLPNSFRILRRDSNISHGPIRKPLAIPRPIFEAALSFMAEHNNATDVLPNCTGEVAHGRCDVYSSHHACRKALASFDRLRSSGAPRSSYYLTTMVGVCKQQMLDSDQCIRFAHKFTFLPHPADREVCHPFKYESPFQMMENASGLEKECLKSGDGMSRHRLGCDKGASYLSPEHGDGYPTLDSVPLC